MINFLKWLSGKKSTIVGIIFTTCSFLVLKGVLDADTAAYIAAITTLVSGVTSQATKILVYPTK